MNDVDKDPESPAWADCLSAVAWVVLFALAAAGVALMVGNR